MEEMDKIVEQSLLYDFYGELLTEHQRQIYEDAFGNDLSLSEIASERGISRQGVHDLLRRCNRLLADYESKLHMVERFERTKRRMQELTRELDQWEASGEGGAYIAGIKKKVQEILEEL